MRFIAFLACCAVFLVQSISATAISLPKMGNPKSVTVKVPLNKSNLPPQALSPMKLSGSTKGIPIQGINVKSVTETSAIQSSAADPLQLNPEAVIESKPMFSEVKPISFETKPGVVTIETKSGVSSGKPVSIKSLNLKPGAPQRLVTPLKQVKKIGSPTVVPVVSTLKKGAPPSLVKPLKPILKSPAVQSVAVVDSKKISETISTQMDQMIREKTTLNMESDDLLILEEKLNQLLYDSVLESGSRIRSASSFDTYHYRKVENWLYEQNARNTNRHYEQEEMVRSQFKSMSNELSDAIETKNQQINALDEAIWTERINASKDPLKEINVQLLQDEMNRIKLDQSYFRIQEEKLSRLQTEYIRMIEKRANQDLEAVYELQKSYIMDDELQYWASRKENQIQSQKDQDLYKIKTLFSKERERVGYSSDQIRKQIKELDFQINELNGTLTILQKKSLELL